MSPENQDDRVAQVISESTTANFRAALSRNGARGAGTDGELHRALQQLVTEAREGGVPAEQVIIHIKRQISELGLSGGRNDRSGPSKIVEELVRLCLDEYYASE